MYDAQKMMDESQIEYLDSCEEGLEEGMEWSIEKGIEKGKQETIVALKGSP